MYSDPEQQRIAKRDSARRRRAAKRASSVPAFIAGKRLLTAGGTVEAGAPIDVTNWSDDAIRVAISVGEIVVPPAPGRARYVATRRLPVGTRTVEAGEEIPEADGFGWGPWLRLGWIEPNPLANVPTT
jgi:hypothetical protein